ncbi:NAD(P)H-dependent oxidoreductase [Bacteroidales bacterium]|nr:NAD(P)H-dependent oxidoreductase [Bacteroidales bacterium]
MSLLKQLQWRYAAKRMNGQEVPKDKMEIILESIRLAPTSMGLQAFHVFVVSDEQTKTMIYEKSCRQNQIKEASHILIFAANTTISWQQVDSYLENIATIRNVDMESLQDFRTYFSPIISKSPEKQFIWTSRQTYIALAYATIAAAHESVDATPIEGFKIEALDELLSLKEKGLSAVSILALGYRDQENDYLTNAKKVRKNKEELFTAI